jgi:uncharacterized protein (TIGR00661 family)
MLNDANQDTKTILVAPLNWGLGHATRCIPIIKALQEKNLIPIIASDGIALKLLRKEFPYLTFLELPSYQIKYPKNGKKFKWKLLQNSPTMFKAIRDEEKLVEKWITEYDIDGIISDNRLGIFSKKIPSVYITHQLRVMSGNTTWLSSKLHQNIIKKHTECWVPDFATSPNLAGELSHLNKHSLKLNYIGPLSRMNKKDLPKKYDLMIILSGPEPQRSILEEKLKNEVKRFKGNVVFIKGVVEPNQIKEQIDTVSYYNFMSSRQLEQTFNESELVLCRSGYTTIMDLVKLNKKAFFIPTPGQYEQLYLAQKLEKESLVPYASQDSFRIENLKKVQSYAGLHSSNDLVNWDQLFSLFTR